MPKYRWKLVKKFIGGHKYFRCEKTGRLAICDQSGHVPETTDDGVLWVNKEKPIQMGRTDDAIASPIAIMLPLIKDDTNPTVTFIGLAELGFLTDMGMSVEVRPNQAEGGEKFTLVFEDDRYCTDRLPSATL